MKTHRFPLLALILMGAMAIGCGDKGTPVSGGGDKGGGAAATAPLLTEAEVEQCKKIYFDRCAGCHGTLRKGATGPSLEPKGMKAKGEAFLKVVMTEGTVKGMPEWGKSGILSDTEIGLLAKFLQMDVPVPPEWSMAEMKATWKLTVKPEDRPKKPAHKRDWQNFFGVILRDVGKVAIIDGDTKEMLSIIETGFAVHILRTSASGRYFYSIGRDGKVTMIDLWMNPPAMVAEVKSCFDARSIDSSKFKGFEDKYAVVGGYSPPSLILLDGQTLKPLKLLSTAGYTVENAEDQEPMYLREARVASIVSSHHDPTFIVNIKETGQIWLVDYSKLANGTVSVDMIDGERFLHDGGWDSTKRYFLVAANAKDTITVIDTKEKKLVANIPSQGTKPHPGRGANLVHPELGPLWATGHIGSNHISFIGTDPEKHPEQAWKVVKQLQLPEDGGGNLFIKTHPNSPHIWADRPLHPKFGQSVHVIDKKTLTNKKTLTIPAKYKDAKAVHLEYNKAGTEMWVAVWGKKDTPTAVLVYDDKTLKLIKEITGDWVLTPTGHFNVFNTKDDIY